jgi:hypothetical protein
MLYRTLESRLLDVIAGSPLDDAGFNALAVEIYGYQRETNLPYAQWCEFTKAPRNIDDWRAIPAVPTSAFRHAALRTFSESETVATFHTSGTTGEGFGRHHFRSLALYEASILAAWRALGIPPLPQIILARKPEEAPHSSLSHMMGTLGAEAPQTWCLDPEGGLDLGAFRRAVTAAIESDQPVLLLGTALAFLHLFEQLGDARFPLPSGSLCMETGGYKGTERTLTKAELYALFLDRLGLQPEAIYNEYSMTELSSQWYTRGLGQPHHGPAWTRALVIDPATGSEVQEGERGVVRLFDLANLGSVQAIQTQDLAIRRGDGFELLGRDPAAIPRGCSRAADEKLRSPAPPLS